MYCPSDVNTGFVELVGPIQQLDLNSITVKSYPLSISFAPRTTPPTLIGNRIDESTENTCTYRGKRFSLVDVQICSVTNKNYKLPGSTDNPVAELILSFSANSSVSDLAELAGILLCVPIYDSGVSIHADYLNQLIDPSIPSCDYTHLTGADYVGGDYQQIPNSNLTSCIKSCCGDTNCLAYTFNQGTCYLKNSIPQLNKNADKSSVTGTVNHNSSKVPSCTTANCPTPSKKGNDKKSGVPNLETIFSAFEGDMTQTSIAYKTCFETIDNNNIPSSKSLYIVVFPNGIHLTQSGYQQLLLQLNGTLSPYMIPPAIRGGDSTLRSYKFDDEGNKVPTITSQDGIIYSTPLSSCTDEFKHRFNYFTIPPKTPTAVAKLSNEQSSYYKTTQYKCMPFNQLADLSGNYVIPGNKTLDTILYEQQQTQLTQNNGNNGITKDTTTNTLTTEQIETYVAMGAGVLIAGIIALKVGSWISNHA
jgi:hypothetical protein